MISSDIKKKGKYIFLIKPKIICLDDNIFSRYYYFQLKDYSTHMTFIEIKGQIQW